MSKRIAENYINFKSENGKTQFLIMRFGNIMGSNGSVLPIFIKQIENGLPITITDASITRYFISKTKACRLILEISNLNILESNIFTFNMGQPIRIKDLADCLITHYPEEKIEIVTIGIRPGEKLNEDIVAIDEMLVPTKNQDILLVKQQNNPAKNIDFNKLSKITPYESPEEIKTLLKSYI